ncbi:30S ribosomal protein S3 [Candidatus Pacearchaeota archaeon CG10_big_fil_rev_8_21_14_0_10_32_14]|nr:MAG: 30S ribosomal protein S3 [Candidatus Pacearchaeota archaeon CG10_big_fil_rev_8_21_14_0_10_32_14]
MEERKTVQLKKDEFSIREYIKTNLGKGKVSKVRIEYTPVGEKIIVSTNKPGLVIGKKGEKIEELTSVLKKRFKLENPHIEIDEIKKVEFDAQLIADEIALTLERMGPLKFKVISYRVLQRIVGAGALGVEIKLSGKLPSSRAKTWRFAQGLLKKTGDPAKVVDKAQAVANTKPGVVGISVSILSPDAILLDKVDINGALLTKVRSNRASVMIEKELEKEKESVKKEKKVSQEIKETKKAKIKTNKPIEGDIKND